MIPNLTLYLKHCIALASLIYASWYCHGSQVRGHSLVLCILFLSLGNTRHIREKFIQYFSIQGLRERISLRDSITPPDSADSSVSAIAAVWTVCIRGDWITNGCGVSVIIPRACAVWPEGDSTRVTAGEPLLVPDAATETWAKPGIEFWPVWVCIWADSLSATESVTPVTESVTQNLFHPAGIQLFPWSVVFYFFFPATFAHY